MPARRIADPAAEPLTVAEAKAYLRLKTADQDALVAESIRSARDAVERATERPLITQTWELRADALSVDAHGLVLPWAAPLQEVLSVEIDRAGTIAPADPAVYAVDNTQEPARLIWTNTHSPIFGYDLPRPSWIVVQYRVGYGDAASAIPPALLQAHRAYMAEHFLRRSITEVLSVGQRTDDTTIANLQQTIDRYKVITV